MGDVICVEGYGTNVGYAARVNANDPTNSVFILVPFAGTETDANIKDCNTLADLEATALSELAANGWNRKTIDQTGGLVITQTEASDKTEVDLTVNPVWTTVTAGTATRLAVCYDSDSTGGADSAILVLGVLDFAVVANGGDITQNVNASGLFRAA